MTTPPAGSPPTPWARRSTGPRPNCGTGCATGPRRPTPTLARRRYRTSVADRRVGIELDSEGTARLSGINLPVDRAAAAEDRLNRLARAAKADGDIRTIAQLRADAMLDLLTGIAFRLRPSNDPHTADADWAEAREQAATYQSTATKAAARAAAAKATARAAAQAAAAHARAAGGDATGGAPPPSRRR